MIGRIGVVGVVGLALGARGDLLTTTRIDTHALSFTKLDFHDAWTHHEIFA